MIRFRRQFVILVFLAMLAQGCISAKQYVPFPDQSVSVEDPSKARIYVIRPSIFGFLAPIDVFDNAAPIGVTGPNSFLSWERKPGMAEILCESEISSHVPIQAEAGKVYYIQQHVRFGVAMLRHHLEVLDREKALKFIKRARVPKAAQEP